MLARGGWGVLVVDRETRFRDRIRGEVTWPWGVAEARRAGLDELLDAAGTAPVRALKRYENGKPAETEWERPAPGDIPGMGFLHPGSRKPPSPGQRPRARRPSARPRRPGSSATADRR